MKHVLVLATVLAFARSGAVSQQKVATRTGTSTHFKTQDSAGNYRFGYDVVHSSGSSFHKEQSSNGVKVGSYGLRDVDGRVRVVNYVADAQGFRADVRTNEPGVEPMKDPAGATINRPPPVAPLPPVSFTVDHSVDLSGGSEPSDEPCDDDLGEQTAAPATETPQAAEATSEAATPAQVPNSPQVASTSQQVPESSVSSTSAPSVVSTVVPSAVLKPVVTPPKPLASAGHAAKQEEPTNSNASQTASQSGGDVPPPELAPETTPKPPRRRPKPRPSVFPPPPPAKPTPAPAAKTTPDSGAPKRVSNPPKRKVHRQGYPYYVRQEDVHIVGMRPPARPYHTRPFGYPGGGIPFSVASFRPFNQPPAYPRAQPPSPAFGPSYFRIPGFPPQLAFQSPRQWPLHPALFGSPGLTNPFSLLPGHGAPPPASFPGFPYRQLKWPYHVHAAAAAAAQAPFDFLSPLVAFQL